MAAPLEVRGLTKRFGSTTAVEDLTFTVPAGRITGFLGPNGAGKTTTISILTTTLAPTGGGVSIDRSSLWTVWPFSSMRTGPAPE